MVYSTFKQSAIAAGFNHGLVEDFIEDLKTVRYRAWADSPTLQNLMEYKSERDSAYNAQAKWDASFRQDPVNPGGYQRGVRGV